MLREIDKEHEAEMSDLFAVETFGRVERLNERGGVTDEERVTDSAGQHADHGQPNVTETLRRIPAITDTQHVRQRLEQCPRVLLRPVRSLYTRHLLHTHSTVALCTFTNAFLNFLTFLYKFSVLPV